MTTYYMTNKGATTNWEKCKATTLAGAKREASAEFQEGNTDDSWRATLVAVGDGITEQRECVARKMGGKWESL